MAQPRDYYELLGIAKDASTEDIKRAYRRQAMKYHPDRNPGDAAAETEFKSCAEAYEVLCDGEKRQLYDRHGHAGLRGNPHHDFRSMHVEDIFSMFNDIFGGSGGGGGGARQRGAARGYDLETEIELELKEVLDGCDRDVEFTRQDVCTACAGSGARPGSSPVSCPTCQGRGQVQQSGLGGMFRMVTTCPNCQGAGKIVIDECTACRGAGRVRTNKNLRVKVPAGIADGQVIRVAGEGEPPRRELSMDGSGVRGDLHAVVRVKEHKDFERDGDDLVMALTIGFSRAALGGVVEVKSIDGAVSIEIPNGSQQGDTVRVDNRGIPNLRSKKRGDLVAVLLLQVPHKLTDRQRQLLEEFARTEKIEPRKGASKSGFWDKMKDLKDSITGG